MFKNKKSSADHFLELVSVLIVLSIFIFLIWSDSKDKQKVIEEKVAELKEESNANNLLIQYLDYNPKECIEQIASGQINLGEILREKVKVLHKEEEFLYNPKEDAENLLTKGDLTFADLINLIIAGEPKQSLEATDFRSRLYNGGKVESINLKFEKGHPYGGYALIWDTCTTDYFHQFDYNYDIVVYFDSNRKQIGSIYVELGGDKILVGQAEIPNFSNRKDIILISLFEIKDNPNKK